MPEWINKFHKWNYKIIFINSEIKKRTIIWRLVEVTNTAKEETEWIKCLVPVSHSRQARCPAAALHPLSVLRKKQNSTIYKKFSMTLKSIMKAIKQLVRWVKVITVILYKLSLASKKKKKILYSSSQGHIGFWGQDLHQVISDFLRCLTQAADTGVY